MTQTWDDGFEEDPFGVSADVFGKSVDEVDVWKERDSFRGDKEWGEFNADSEEEDDRYREKKTRSRSDRDKSDRDRRREGDRRSQDSSSRRHHSSSRDRDHRSSRDHHASSSRREDRRRSEDDRRRSEDRRSRGGSRSKSNSNSNRPSMSPQKSPRREFASFEGSQSPRDFANFNGKPPQSPRHFANFEKDPFGIGESSTPASSAFDNDGFPASNAGFADFGGGFNAFKDAPPKSPKHHRPAFTDDILESEFKSAGGSSFGATSSRKILSKNHGSSGSGRSGNLVKRRDGMVTRPRASEQRLQRENSGRRRGAVRDSLKGALGDGDEDEPTLASFLKDEKKSSGGRKQSREIGSVHSAPAISTGRSSSRRYDRSSGSRRDRRKTEEQPLKLDIAQLAAAGHIEVVDGKMRLVIDVDD